MYEMEVSVGEDMFQIIYREDQAEAAELAWMEPEAEFPASVGYRIGSSRLRWSLAHGIVMIQPTDVTVRMDAPYYSYLHTANGRAYIEDAVSRGIDLCERVDTYLEVYQISAQFGEISERIPLTVEEAAGSGCGSYVPGCQRQAGDDFEDVFLDFIMPTRMNK